MGHKILLADDSITIQKVIELTFSDEDFELHTVGNGQKAIDEIRSIMPDVVLCDIIMPEKNGYEVCEFIKSSGDLKHIPVLLLTGAFEPFDQERAKAAGCEGFLAKPFEPQTLISRVKELLDNAVKPAAAAPAPAPRPAPAPPPPPAASFDSMESDATVLVPPPSAAAPPRPSGPQVSPSPSPPPIDASGSGSGSGVDDAFAVEAGERELSMGPGDHTVLLGAQDVGSSASSGGGSGSGDDDVWGQVTAQSDEEEASTVFMAAPPPIAEAPKPKPPQEVTRSSGDPDATWQMPSESPAGSDSASDAPGFQEFAPPPEPPKPATPPQPQADAFEPVFDAEPEPEPEPEPVEASFEPIESQSYQDFEPLSGDTMSGVSGSSGYSTDQTIDPVVSSDPFEPISEPEPEVVSAPPPAPSPPKPAPAPPPAPAVAPKSGHTSASASTVSSNSDGVDEALVEKIAQRVVDKLSSRVIQEIAWEVVPDLAEGLIVKEIEALKAKIPK